MGKHKKCHVLNHACQCCDCDRKKGHKGAHRIRRSGERVTRWTDDETAVYCAQRWAELVAACTAANQQLDSLAKVHRRLATTVAMDCDDKLFGVECAMVATAAMGVRAVQRYMCVAEQFRRPHTDMVTAVGPELWYQHELMAARGHGLNRELFDRLGVGDVLASLYPR